MTSTQEKTTEITTEKEKKEEVESSSSDEEHEHGHDHHGHDHDHDHDHDHGKGGDKKANKGEKKFKKAMSKLGMKPVPGITRVTIKKAKSFFLYIDDPEVLKSPGVDNTYIIFGDPKIQDFSQGLANQEASQFASKEKPVAETKPEESQKPAEKPAESTEELSEEGLTAANIEMVISHTKCTRAEAVKALRDSNDDSVQAILALTK